MGCQDRASTPGSGPQPNEGEWPAAASQLQAVVNGTEAPAYAELETASALGVTITRELVDA